MSACAAVTSISCHWPGSVVMPNSVMKPSSVREKPLNIMPPITVTKLARPWAAVRLVLGAIDQRAVRAAVEPVDEHAEVEPDEEAHPRDHRQAEHQVEAREDAEHREDGAAGTLNGRVASGRLHAQHDAPPRRPRRTRTASRCWSSRRRRRSACTPATRATTAARDDGGDVRRAEPRVHLAHAGRQQAVAAHREEDARLAHAA